MILLALLLAAAPPGSRPPAPAHVTSTESRFDDCVQRADASPEQAVADARKWAGSGGGVPAGQCLGLAQTANGDYKGAAATFAATADLAEQMRDGRAANLWVSAGNAALAGGDGTHAKVLLDRAIALPTLGDPMKGEAWLDRARADVALGSLPEARTDMDSALKLVPADPMTWLLSATLARRMADPIRARHDIVEAATRAPREPAILFESGNIYAAGGEITQARGEWTRARDADPDSDAAHSAVRELAASGGVPPTVAPKGR